MDLVCVTVDCQDPEMVARFWNDALRWGGVAVGADGAGALCRPPGGGTYLEFVRVPEPKSVKNRSTSASTPARSINSRRNLAVSA